MTPIEETILDWTRPKARVLDLGCGDGQLLRALMDNKGVEALGLEISLDSVTRCVAKGVPVLHMDIDKGLQVFEEDRFDVAILKYTLSEVHHPRVVFREMLRVAHSAVIVFSNFAYWKVRWSLFTRGRMPVTKHFPYEWYNTPNIHPLSIRDIEQMCSEENAPIVQRAYNSESGFEMGLCGLGLHNLMADSAIFHIKRGSGQIG